MKSEIRIKYRRELYALISIMALVMTIITYLMHLDGVGDFMHKGIADRYAENNCSSELLVEPIN